MRNMMFVIAMFGIAGCNSKSSPTPAATTQAPLAASTAAATAAATTPPTPPVSNLLTATLVNKGFEKADVMARQYHDQITFDVAFKNNGTKDLNGAKGSIVFSDDFGDKIVEVEIKVQEKIAAGATYTWSGAMDMNHFKHDDQTLANTPKSRLKVAWVPEMYLFADGTKLEVE